MELGEGKLLSRSIFGLPKEGGLIGLFLEMPVQAVVRDVQLSAREPFRMREFPFQGTRRALEPVESISLLRPKALGSLKARSFILRYSLRDRTCARLLNSSGGGTACSSKTCGSNSCIFILRSRRRWVASTPRQDHASPGLSRPQYVSEGHRPGQAGSMPIAPSRRQKWFVLYGMPIPSQFWN